MVSSQLTVATQYSFLGSNTAIISPVTNVFPFLGISMVDLTPEVKDEINRKLDTKIKNNQGVVITRVIQDSPAEKAGLRQGDVIQKVGGVVVKSPTEVQQEVEKSLVGKNLAVEVMRNRKIAKILVRPDAFPESFELEVEE